MTRCWNQPRWTALEIAWRWAFGIPALALVWFQEHKILFAATGGTMEVARLGLDSKLLHDPVGALTANPMQAAGQIAVAMGLVRAGVLHAAVWLVPLLLLGWVVVSSLGRDIVLRSAEPRMHSRVGTLIALQTVRILTLAGVFAFWFIAIRWSAMLAITGPIARNEDPNLVLYCALLIIATLGLFTLWAFVSWVLSVAPLLAMQRDLSASASTRAALKLGPLKGKLVEVNLVMGIVKIMLLVLAMVFSASPLPFEQQTSFTFLLWWWAGVSVLYLLWSDFFQVVRLVSYLDLWRRYDPA